MISKYIIIWLFNKPRRVNINNGTCKHHVGACLVTKHIDPNDREFLTIVGRGRPKVQRKNQLKERCNFNILKDILFYIISKKNY